MSGRVPRPVRVPRPTRTQRLTALAHIPCCYCGDSLFFGMRADLNEDEAAAATARVAAGLRVHLIVACRGMSRGKS